MVPCCQRVRGPIISPGETLQNRHVKISIFGVLLYCVQQAPEKSSKATVLLNITAGSCLDAEGLSAIQLLCGQASLPGNKSIAVCHAGSL